MRWVLAVAAVCVAALLAGWIATRGGPGLATPVPPAPQPASESVLARLHRQRLADVATQETAASAAKWGEDFVVRVVDAEYGAVPDALVRVVPIDARGVA